MKKKSNKHVRWDGVNYRIKDGKLKLGQKYYTAKQIHILSILYYILGILLIVISLPIMPIGIIFLLLGVGVIWFGWSYSHFRKILLNAQTIHEQPTQDTTSEYNYNEENLESETSINSKVKQSHSKYPFKDDEDRFLRYSYYDVDVKGFSYQNFDITKLELDKFVTFDFEPDNPYDPNAIAIFYDDQKIGYIPRNSLQSMVKDYSDGIEHQICGFISYINEELNEVHLGLGFYSKENKNLDVMTCKLIKTKMKDFMGNSRQDNLAMAEIGSPVELEYSYDSDTYIVNDDTGFELGEISKKQSEKLFDVIGDTKPFYAGINELEMDDDGNYICKIKVWYR